MLLKVLMEKGNGRSRKLWVVTSSVGSKGLVWEWMVDGLLGGRTGKWVVLSECLPVYNTSSRRRGCCSPEGADWGRGTLPCRSLGGWWTPGQPAASNHSPPAVCNTQQTSSLTLPYEPQCITSVRLRRIKTCHDKNIGLQYIIFSPPRAVS